MNDRILLGHGSGGRLSNELVQNLFIRYFGKYSEIQCDSVILKITPELIAFTTDSYVVDPIFFPGGNIGKLAVCGTVNDLAVSGAKPLYISVGFIIEEGFLLSELEQIVKSMANEANSAGVKIVTGDTKIVNKAKCDKIFINTSGIGEISEKNKNISIAKNIELGDKIIINGYIGDHGIAVLAKRENLHFNSSIESDCASLNTIIAKVTEQCNVKFMRDATRGGVASVLNELAEQKNIGIEIVETTIPVRENVKGMCEIFGFDPLYVANEGKVIMVIAKEDANKALSILQKDELGKNAAIIGEISENYKKKVVLHTIIGGKRIVDMLAGEQLPRIC